MISKNELIKTNAGVECAGLERDILEVIEKLVVSAHNQDMRSISVALPIVQSHNGFNGHPITIPSNVIKRVADYLVFLGYSVEPLRDQLMIWWE